MITNRVFIKKVSFINFLLTFIKYVFFTICVIIALFPIIWVIMSSFKTNAQILTNGIALPTTFNFNGYTAALRISPLPSFFLNSILISSVTTILNVLFLAMAAYVFARFTFPFKNLLYFILSLSLVLPMTALLHPVYLMVNTLRLTNTRSGLVLVYTALNLPMSLLILRSTFQAIPSSLEDAAHVDGAGFVRIFFQVMMPVAKGGLTTAGVLSFLYCWNEFTFALILTSSQRVRTLPLSFSYFVSQFSKNYTAMFAAITIAVLPSIIVFAIFQEQIVNSLVAGALKE